MRSSDDSIAKAGESSNPLEVHEFHVQLASGSAAMRLAQCLLVGVLLVPVCSVAIAKADGLQAGAATSNITP